MSGGRWRLSSITGFRNGVRLSASERSEFADEFVERLRECKVLQTKAANLAVQITKRFGSRDFRTKTIAKYVKVLDFPLDNPQRQSDLALLLELLTDDVDRIVKAILEPASPDGLTAVSVPLATVAEKGGKAGPTKRRRNSGDVRSAFRRRLKRRLRLKKSPRRKAAQQHRAGPSDPLKPNVALGQGRAHPQTLGELASLIRRDTPRRGALARLFELMDTNVEVAFETLQDKVHEFPVSDDAIKKQITNARRVIRERGLPFALVVCNRRLLREPVRNIVSP